MENMECKACGYIDKTGKHFRKLLTIEAGKNESFDSEDSEIIMAYACPCCGTMRINV